MFKKLDLSSEEDSSRREWRRGGQGGAGADLWGLRPEQDGATGRL